NRQIVLDSTRYGGMSAATPNIWVPGVRGDGGPIEQLEGVSMAMERLEGTATELPEARAASAQNLTTPQGKGLSIARRFVPSGVNPYDEVEWEIRSAVIQGEGGETVFEQRDVEVPKSWSQLATNVVVSKYFRGTLGTPQRERSVRQLIGRVVTTISTWGEEQGYFATPSDRQTFVDELTHLLVQQKLCFNSPVWFNVGVEPKPQCS